MDYPNTPHETAALDQAATSLENMAKLMGTYYLALRREGIPKPLAAEMTLDYQQYTLSRLDDANG